MIALAIDGMDIVRGRGDPAGWPFTEYVAVTGLTPRGEAAAPSLRDQVRPRLPRPTTVVATGDILQSRCSLTQIRATGDWGAALRGPTGEYLAAADLALGSLDGSIQDIGAPYGCVEITNLTSPPEVMEALTLAGFDEMTIATNHVFDCGQTYCGNRAFLRTIELLQQAGIKIVGGGKNLEEALAPAIFEVNGTRFGVLGFDDIAAMDLEATDTEPGTAPLDDDYSEERKAGEAAFYRPASELSLTRFTETIRKLKQQVDVVIVQVQTGTEDTHEPTDRSIKALRAAVDAGADLVVGNQAHWVQAVEVRNNAFIAYALGNFIFDQVHTPEHTQGYLLEATFRGKQLTTVRLLPYQIANRYKPVFAEGPLHAKIIGDVIEAARKLPPR
jgi:poly-gamma-glutamate capsule biosynthesis protein CapA/YwtB (metallophosphatase superfamily)